MLLYGHHESGHAYKVRLFLLLAQVEHRYEWVDISRPRDERSAEFQTASAYGEVPVLVDEGRSWCQSNAILIHLAQKFGQMTGQADEWPQVMEWLFWEPNRINFSIPNLRFSHKFVPQPQPVMDYLTRRAHADLGTLNTHLAHQAFLLPSGCTIADLSCASYLFWLNEAQLDVSAYPNVSRWLIELSLLPNWQPAYQALQAP
jgi:glutathione S-transferase